MSQDLLTEEQFLAAYPDFKAPPPAGHLGIVANKLAEAALEIDPTVFLEKTSTIHGLLTAHKLSRSVYGKNAKMTGAISGQTVYWAEVQRLYKQVAQKRRPVL